MSLPTQEQIVARLEAVAERDFFGAQSQELLSALDFENAKAFLQPQATKTEWDAKYPMSEDAIRDAARAYFDFAIGKATDHRGLSAGRSIDHYRGWVFLLANDKIEEFEDAEYAQYGVPQLKLAADLLGFPEEWDRHVAAGLMNMDHSLTNMSVGKPCEPNCAEGCGVDQAMVIE